MAPPELGSTCKGERDCGGSRVWTRSPKGPWEEWVDSLAGGPREPMGGLLEDLGRILYKGADPAPEVLPLRNLSFLFDP